MKVKETFVIKVTRTTEVVEQYYDETLDDIRCNLDPSKEQLKALLEEQGFSVGEGGFISANVATHSM